MKALRRLMALLALVGLNLPLAACGKKGSPHAPGPAGEIIYPRTYPAPD
jgi:predicted small lipoprotein YifL